jgi:hypothetical protein
MPSNVISARDEGGLATTTTLVDAMLAPALQTRRPFRWASIGAAVVVVAIIAIAILWLPRAADTAAVNTRQTYHEVSLEVREFLPTAQASLDVVTKPSSTDAALGTVIPVVSELSSHASHLGAVAAEPLPATLPFVPNDAIDALAPLRDRSAILATDTAEVARQIGHGYVYRTSIPQLLDVGELPSSANTDEINRLSVSLAASLAENASLVSDLPSNAAFEAVQSSAREAIASYAQWQDRYLAALANNDVTTADTLVAEIKATRASILGETSQTLLEFRESMDDRIVSLAEQFDAHLSDLDR